MTGIPSNHRRKRAQDLSRFLGLVGTPGNLVTGVTLPAPAKLYAACAVTLAAATAVVTIKGRSYSMGAGPANVPQPVQYAERDAFAIKAAGAPGVITLYVQGPLGKLLKIAQG